MSDGFDEKKVRENYWLKRVTIKDDPSSVRVDGTQYIIGGEGQHLPGFPGHGGVDFYIRFDDGRLAHTRNLWLNGEIPANFRDALPDNARFLDQPEFERLARERDPQSPSPDPDRPTGRSAEVSSPDRDIDLDMG